MISDTCSNPYRFQGLIGTEFPKHGHIQPWRALSRIAAATFLPLSTSTILLPAGPSAARRFTGCLNSFPGIEPVFLIQSADFVSFQIWFVAERAIRYAQNALGRSYGNRDVGRHAGEQ